MKSGGICGEDRTKQLMAASGPVSNRTSWLQDFNSMMVSASCHFLILICLGLIAVGGSGGHHSDQLVMTLGEGGGGQGGQSEQGDEASSGTVHGPSSGRETNRPPGRAGGQLLYHSDPRPVSLFVPGRLHCRPAAATITGTPPSPFRR